MAGSVVVLDVKQENWDATAGFRQKLRQTTLLFNPLDAAGRTCRYNPFSHIDRRDEVDVINELQKIGAMLFPPPQTGDSFWAESARTAFLGVAAYVAATADDGEDALPFTMGEVYRQFAAGDAKRRFPRIIRQREVAGKPLSGACVSALRDWFTASDNTFTSIRQSVTAKINLWLNPYVDAATAESDFDLRSFREERISLYLGVSPDDLDRVAPIYNLLFQQLIDLNVRASLWRSAPGPPTAPARRISTPRPRLGHCQWLQLCRGLRHPPPPRHPERRTARKRLRPQGRHGNRSQLRRPDGDAPRHDRRCARNFRKARHLHLSCAVALDGNMGTRRRICFGLRPAPPALASSRTDATARKGHDRSAPRHSASLRAQDPLLRGKGHGRPDQDPGPTMPTIRPDPAAATNSLRVIAAAEAEENAVNAPGSPPALTSNTVKHRLNRAAIDAARSLPAKERATTLFGYTVLEQPLHN
jgi:type IV secretion system protein VirD4